MKVKVLLDIDGVIANFYTGFAKHLNENVGAGLDLNKGPANYSLHDWGHNLSRDIVDEQIPEWILSGGYANMPIFPGAKEFVYKLMDKYDVYIVTARVGDFTLDLSGKVQKVIKRDTFKWLRKYGIPSNKLFFEHKKIDFCQKNNIPILIEDKLPTVIDGADKGVRSILMDRSWNQDSDGLQRDHFNIFVAYNYEDILKILEELTGES
jgi:uncharacterized HAD superfamily protein